MAGFGVGVGPGVAVGVRAGVAVWLGGSSVWEGSGSVGFFSSGVLPGGPTVVQAASTRQNISKTRRLVMGIIVTLQAVV